MVALELRKSGRSPGEGVYFPGRHTKLECGEPNANFSTECRNESIFIDSMEAVAALSGTIPRSMRGIHNPESCSYLTGMYGRKEMFTVM